jgi:hypothetical protein
MSVYGGLEFTENSVFTTLHRYPGQNPGGPVPPDVVLTIGGRNIGVYHISAVNFNAWAGPINRQDAEVLRDGRVALTNDTITAEWVIDGHSVAGLSVDQMINNMQNDIQALFNLRQQVKNQINALKFANPGAHIVLAPNAPNNIHPAGNAGLFEYSPGDQVNGAAQITVQYEKLDTITRICKLNASRYLPGTKVATGDDADLVADTLGLLSRGKYAIGEFSFTNAQTLLDGLTDLATPINSEAGPLASKQQLGLIMLMIVNDAMATTMRRFAARIGQTADKNIQRFFPKSRRNKYVNAVTRRDFPANYMPALRAQLIANANQMAQLEWDSCDALSLSLAATNEELINIRGAEGLNLGGLDGQEAGRAAGMAQGAALSAIQAKSQQGQPVSPGEIAQLKNAVLGPNGNILAARIIAAAHAYTDATPNGTEHYDAVPNARVIKSLRFTPVTDGVYGAVYEFRDREVEMAPGQVDEILATMRKLLDASV